MNDHHPLITSTHVGMKKLPDNIWTIIFPKEIVSSNAEQWL